MKIDEHLGLQRIAPRFQVMALHHDQLSEPIHEHVQIWLTKVIDIK